MKQLFKLCMGVLLMASCKDPIVIDIPNNNPLLVVEGVVSSELDSSFVKLSLSSNYYASPNYKTVETAVVRVNGIDFIHKGSGIYRPYDGFIGKVDSTYNLSINYEDKNYTSTSTMVPMFRVDSLSQTFKPKEGFLPEGYSISYWGFDDRKPIKYTYFQSGFFDADKGKDSTQNNLVLFDNNSIPLGRQYAFELPFTRFNSGTLFFCTFRSIDKDMFDFLKEYGSQSSGAPGPFRQQPANLPTNIKGGAVGYFATFDVKRFRYMVK